MAKEKAGAEDHARTGGNDTGPARPDDGGAAAAAAAELPFSDMIARWLDDGDKLHERVHEPNEFASEIGGHEGRVRAFVENARAQAHRHRRVIGGAELLVVIVSVISFRQAHVGHPRSGDLVSVDSTTASAAPVAAATVVAVAAAAPATSVAATVNAATAPSSAAAPAVIPATAESPIAANPAPAQRAAATQGLTATAPAANPAIPPANGTTNAEPAIPSPASEVQAAAAPTAATPETVTPATPEKAPSDRKSVV